QNLDLAVTLPDADLKTIFAVFPQAGKFDLQGKGTASLFIRGSVARPAIEGTAEVSGGMFYGQKFGGLTRFAYKTNLFNADIQNLSAYRGTSSAKVQIVFSKKEPQVDLQAKISKLDLAALAQNAPGIEGLAAGSLKLSGSPGNLRGQLTADLSRALIFGQPIQNLSSSFRIKDGDFQIEDIRTVSNGLSFSGHGKISRDLVFDLRAEAEGLRLSGRGILGKMQATLNKFKGGMRAQINQAFLHSPLRNLSASGEAVLTAGQIGEQLFDRAEGKIELNKGRIQMKDVFFQKGNSTLEASGQIGFGTPTLLRIAGNGIKLEDVKILNHFLPPGIKNPRGTVSMEVEVTGALSRETHLVSFDPLLGLTAKGKMLLLDNFWADVPVARALVDFSWQEQTLSIPDCRIEMPDSTLDLDLKLKRDGTISASLKGAADFSHFQNPIKNYGRLSGQAGVNLKLEGRVGNPDLTASFRLNQCRFNEVGFDSVTGSLNYSRHKLTILEPILFRNGQDLYTLSGNASLSTEAPAGSAVDLELKILEADLPSVYRLFGKLRGEVVRRLFLPAESKTVKIVRANLALPTYLPYTHGERIQFYSSDSKKNYFLKTWGDIRLDYEKNLSAAPEENLGGKLAGSFRLKGKVRNPTGKLNFQLARGYFRTFVFDEFTGSANLKNGEIKIEKAVLKKDRGDITFRGDYNFNGVVFLSIVANEMPLDLLRVIFPDKEFKGYFSMNAGLDGPIQNPRISVAAGGRDITIAGIDFDRATFSVTKKNGNLYFHEVSLLQGKSLSSLYGNISLSSPGQINLEANLVGNTIGLLNLFTNEIKWLKGNASISTKIRGTLEKPHFEGEISVTDGALQVKAANSELRRLQGNAVIKNNSLHIENLTGSWVSEKTRGWPNLICLAGTIDLNKVLAEKNMVNLNLVFNPAHLYIAIPNLYTGSLHIRELALEGPFYFNLSEGPLLKGRLEADNALITLPRTAAQPGKIFPLNFNLEADLASNVYATMGEVFTYDLSNVLMNLEIAGEKLKLSGRLDTPNLQGKISIKRGTVNILNQEFNILPPEAQKKFFPYDSEKIKENTASFTGETGHGGILPEINLTSTVNVENPEKDESGKYVKKKVAILARLEGTIGAAEKERGLKILLSGFTEDKTKSPPEMVPAVYNEQDLKVMLLPDFIKSLAGIGRPEEINETKTDTSVVIADYLNSRVQALLFRPLERELEQKLGLESLTLEYNLGPKIKETIGIKETKGFEEEKPAWSVAFAKGFFDRLFIDFRYSQGVEQTTGSGATTTFNYQLTYKFNPIWSIIYFREPASLTDINTGFQKITLKAGFSLW
ncbi:translocation/assembly module TamB domain-containing protein, partial [Candidatus Saganbacteria bacterium]|nr:translocation/assembly module TamB domain-containing protein [Candidatus Saganbacteria bacterium]